EDPHLARVFDETDRHVIDTRSLADADAVVVDTHALQSSERSLIDAVDEWSRLDARQPLIVLGDAESALAAAAQVVIAPGEIVTFDPDLRNPMRNARRQPSDDETLDAVAAAASGTPLLREDAAPPPNAIERDRLAVQARRWAYGERAPWVIAHSLLDQAGVPHPPPEPRVAGLLVSMRPDDVLRAIERFATQRYEAKELVVVCHGFDPGPARSALDAGAITHQVFEIARDRPLGTCLNAAAEATSADVLAKIDDDDHYGPGFLGDAVDALRYSTAEVIGKAAHFTYVQGNDVTVLRRSDAEERFVDGSVAGGSMVFRRRIWEDVRFPIRPRRVDALFLRGARALGARIYANGRWDFVYRRREEDQTWRAADDVFLSSTEPAWDGDHPERANA
ncbi:MAG: glycosyltransferase family A protein, partial [Actinomycetota bacterium]|nr:glycosyltransferase family A protein [Actinomycetota bacterium]